MQLKAPKVSDMRFTLEKPYGQKRVTRTELTPEVLLELLRDGKHREGVEELRRQLPATRGKPMCAHGLCGRPTSRCVSAWHRSSPRATPRRCWWMRPAVADSSVYV